jgi:hypothetical protein
MICLRCSVVMGQNWLAGAQIIARRLRQRAEQGLRSLNAEEAKFPGRFVEFRSSRSTT